MAEEKALGHEGYFQYSGGISWVNPYVKTHQTVHLRKYLKALWHPAGRLSWALWTATSATLLGPTADHLLLRSPDSCRSPSETRGSQDLEKRFSKLSWVTGHWAERKHEPESRQVWWSPQAHSGHREASSKLITNHVPGAAVTAELAQNKERGVYFWDDPVLLINHWGKYLYTIPWEQQAPDKSQALQSSHPTDLIGWVEGAALETLNLLTPLAHPLKDN